MNCLKAATLLGVLFVAASPASSFPALGAGVGPVNSPFGSPSQAIFSPSGGNILYRSASQIPQGQLIPANSEIAAKATGGKGKCSVYYYCCIFYCWSKWTPCGCYLVCADREQGGTMIPVDQPQAGGAVTNEFFDPPSATVGGEYHAPVTPPTFHGEIPGRADVEPIDNNHYEPPPMPMGGGPGADKKVSDDDEKQPAIIDDDHRFTESDRYPTPAPHNEEEADPNEEVEPEWEEDRVTQPPFVPPPPPTQAIPEFVPIDEEEDPYDPQQGEEIPYEEIEDPNEEQQFETEDDDTLIAFGQVQGRRPLLVRFPQTGVAFEARSSDNKILEKRAAARKDKKNKNGGRMVDDEDSEPKKEKKGKKTKQERERAKAEREERRREKKERKQRDRKSKQQNVDSKFVW